ncbi:MAG: peptidase M23 [Methylophilaceae bacterium 17-44-8]|nr:MAG: peptidase M23 [Methylophilales bacterium 28-44-11]OZA06893.1 MAG: peptidase M23 [Methylophilaceae bacterium 17-44-8]
MFSERKFSRKYFKLHWLAFASGLLALILFLAVSETPQAETSPVILSMITEEVSLPLPSQTIDRNEAFWQIEQVRQDDTLESLFRRMNVRDQEAIKYLMLSPDAHALNTQLIPGHTVEVKSNLQGKLLYLEYELDAENILVAGLTSNGYVVATKKLLLESQQVLKSAVIRDTLFGATDDAGIPDQIAIQIADILSSEIDFYQDLRNGDRFHVIYEAFYNAGEMMKTGNVLAVEFVNDGKVYQAIHFGDTTGKYAYYTPDGKSLHKTFLRSPLEYTRISSSFNAGRYHPILQRIKAHRGVDMAAPTGTRVKASGDGVVAFMGRKGGYGNVVVLNHPSGVSTVYGHLSRFSDAIRKGDTVNQGDIIGYVGMTGLATGPHLHYEFLVNGSHRDPMKVALPTSIPLDDNFKSTFQAHSLTMLAKLEMLKQRMQLAAHQAE